MKDYDRVSGILKLIFTIRNIRFLYKKKDGFKPSFFIPFSFIPIDYLTTCDTKFATSKNESLTNSFANVLIGLFSITSNT